MKFDARGFFVLSYDVSTKGLDISDDEASTSVLLASPKYYFRFETNLKKRQTVLPRFILGVDVDGYLLPQLFGQEDLEGVSNQVFVGGFNPYLENSIPFYGLPQSYESYTNLLTGRLIVRYSPVKNLYISGIWSSLVTSGKKENELNDWIKFKNFNFSGINSVALELAYYTFAGPVQFSVAKAEGSKNSFKFYIGLGFDF